MKLFMQNAKWGLTFWVLERGGWKFLSYFFNQIILYFADPPLEINNDRGHDRWVDHQHTFDLWKVNV